MMEGLQQTSVGFLHGALQKVLLILQESIGCLHWFGAMTSRSFGGEDKIELGADMLQCMGAGSGLGHFGRDSFAVDRADRTSQTPHPQCLPQNPTP